MMKIPEMIQAYAALCKPCTESPMVYHDWSFLTSVGALLGRQVYMKFGFDVVYPNMYTCLIGPPAGRKSAAINLSKRIIQDCGYKKFAKEKTSKEMFLSLLGSGLDKEKGKKPSFISQAVDVNELLDSPIEQLDELLVSEGFISVGELIDFLGVADMPFISLLTNLYDNLPKYEQPKLTGKDVYVHMPTVSLLGGATATSFGSMFPPEALGGGMISRMLLVKGDGARQKLTIPPEPDWELYEQIVVNLRVMKENFTGAISYSPEAYKLVDRIYKSDHPIKDSRLDTYVGRRHMHLNKLCIILAALELKNVIEPDIVVFANTILHDIEKTMPESLGESGLGANSQQAQSIVNSLQIGPISLEALFKKVSNDFKSRQEMMQVVQKLKEAGKITSSGTMITLPTAKNKATSLPYIEPKLLEYRND